MLRTSCKDRRRSLVKFLLSLVPLASVQRWRTALNGHLSRFLLPCAVSSTLILSWFHRHLSPPAPPITCGCQSFILCIVQLSSHDCIFVPSIHPTTTWTPSSGQLSKVFTLQGTFFFFFLFFSRHLFGVKEGNGLNTYQIKELLNYRNQ